MYHKIRYQIWFNRAKILEFTAKCFEWTVQNSRKHLSYLPDHFLYSYRIREFPDKSKSIMSISGKPITYFSTIIQNNPSLPLDKNPVLLINRSSDLCGIVDHWGSLSSAMGFDRIFDELYSAYWIDLCSDSGSAVCFGAIRFSEALWTLDHLCLSTMLLVTLLNPGSWVELRPFNTGCIPVSSHLGICFGTGSMFLSVPITMTIKIIMEHNEKTLWIAILLGTQPKLKPMLNMKKRIKETTY